MKALIFQKENGLKPVGGPVGYLYNIKVMKDALQDSEICFLNSRKTSMNLGYLFFRAISVLEKKLSRNTTKDPVVMTIEDTIKKSKMLGKVSLKEYDLVHFHDTLSMYSQKRSLDRYSGTVVLTSHSPKVMYKEMIEDNVDEKTYLKNKALFDGAEIFDEYAFKRADYIIFPCPGAEEPYYHTWPKYAELRDSSKIRYVPTGILPVICPKGRSKIRGELHIPEDAIVLSFVGRHNEVKGYDLLQRMFEKLDNVYVVCCGKIGTIQPPKSQRWIEVGWITDPYSYVGASDIYVLPNRETYFDIAMLQTLSIGKCSVISNTGGNREFLNTPGVKLYDTIDEGVACIKTFSEMNQEKRRELETRQRDEFSEKYKIEVFYTKYKQTLKDLLTEKEQYEK